MPRMKQYPFVKIYPVFNGTCVLLSTADGKYILIDCKLTKTAEDPKSVTHYNVKGDLVDILPRNSYGAPYVDLFILTHPDYDHCHGFENNFFTGAPGKYSKSDEEAELIMINELWTSKIIYGEVCDDAQCIRRELDRRRSLYNSTDHLTGSDYNRMSMIGYDDDDKFTSCPSYYPGDLVKYIAGTTCKYTELFIHGPFKKSLIQATATEDRNVASVMIHYRLSSPDHSKTLRLIEGGDADHYQWKAAKEKSEEHGNTEFLYFDVMIASHHCSWSYYNDRPYAKHTIPQRSSCELIETYMLPNGFIISSSKEIVNDEDNPPHHPAKQQYIKDMPSDGTFLCTGEEPTRAEPKPIVLELTADGVVKKNTATVKTASRNKAQRNFLLTNPGYRSYGM